MEGGDQMTFFVSHSIKVWHGLLDAIVDSTLLILNMYQVAVTPGQCLLPLLT